MPPAERAAAAEEVEVGSGTCAMASDGPPVAGVETNAAWAADAPGSSSNA